eukprot:13756139-Ditylum_brightwellii.AAC.1
MLIHKKYGVDNLNDGAKINTKAFLPSNKAGRKTSIAKYVCTNTANQPLWPKVLLPEQEMPF